MRIAVIGTGYVGTVAGACFAESGNEVVCVDKDPRKVAALSGGDPVIFEPGLNAVLERNLSKGRIRFTTSMREAVLQSEIIFLTVGTPPLPNGEADLSSLREAAQEIGRALESSAEDGGSAPRIVVNKSTVPVGTHRRVADWIRSETDTLFDVVSNPEFLREGAALQDFLKPERVVIGTSQKRAFKRMKSLYSPFVGDPSLILWMDPVSAELTKYACNAFLATRISFMNEVAQLCERTGGDVESIRRGMALDSRIGRHFLHPGIGYGGSCFPKDIRALISTARQEGMDLRIVQATEEVNRIQKTRLMASITRQFGKKLRGRTFALWGLAFKPETDDIREAPALMLIESLLAAGAAIRAYDPVAMDRVREALGERIVFCEDEYEALKGADALILATEWEQFKRADMEKVRKRLKGPFVFDGRNAFSPEEVLRAGLHYQGIGRGLLPRGLELVAPPPAENPANSSEKTEPGIEPGFLTA